MKYMKICVAWLNIISSVALLPPPKVSVSTSMNSLSVGQLSAVYMFTLEHQSTIGRYKERKFIK